MVKLDYNQILPFIIIRITSVFKVGNRETGFYLELFQIIYLCNVFVRYFQNDWLNIDWCQLLKIPNFVPIFPDLYE